jgi:uncharacterized protein
MENFSNETIDTTNLPKFENVVFSKLHQKYWNVILINLILFFLVASLALIFALVNIGEIANFQIQFAVGFIILVALIVIFSRIGFLKKGFAFRDHDVLFTKGIIVTNTIVIPYNRVQHVALHEGVISRYFGLAKIEIFTAGGSNSDIEIPGIEKEQAENIKQLLMGKIQKQL